MTNKVLELCYNQHEYKEEDIQEGIRQQDAPQPEGWRAQKCASTNLIYYVDDIELVTTWTTPLWPLPIGWTEKKDSEGLSFYIYKSDNTINTTNDNDECKQQYDNAIEEEYKQQIDTYNQTNSKGSTFVTYEDPRGKLASVLLSYHNIPLPNYIDVRVDSQGYIFFIDQKNEISTWTDPRNPLPKNWSQKRILTSQPQYLPLCTIFTNIPVSLNKLLLKSDITSNNISINNRIRPHTQISIYYCQYNTSICTSQDIRRPLPYGWCQKLEQRGLYYVNIQQKIIQWVSPLDSLPPNFTLHIVKSTHEKVFHNQLLGLTMSCDPRLLHELGPILRVCSIVLKKRLISCVSSSRAIHVGYQFPPSERNSMSTSSKNPEFLLHGSHNGYVCSST